MSEPLQKALIDYIETVRLFASASVHQSHQIKNIRADELADAGYKLKKAIENHHDKTN